MTWLHFQVEALTGTSSTRFKPAKLEILFGLEETTWEAAAAQFLEFSSDCWTCRWSAVNKNLHLQPCVDPSCWKLASQRTRSLSASKIRLIVTTFTVPL